MTQVTMQRNEKQNEQQSARLTLEIERINKMMKSQSNTSNSQIEQMSFRIQKSYEELDANAIHIENLNKEISQANQSISMLEVETREQRT